jgi:biotin transport system substrate-specific component
MTTRDIVYVALFASLTAALGMFPPIPLPVVAVPITAQSMGPMLAGAILGARRGMLSQLLFLVMVAIGLPLLSGGRGGAAVFFGPSAGYLFAWPLAALVIGFLFERFWLGLTAAKAFLIIFFGGIICLYPLGILWTSFVSDLSLLRTAGLSAPFLIGDLIKVTLATFVALTARSSYPLMPGSGAGAGARSGS